MDVQRFMSRLLESWNNDDNSKDFTLRIPDKDMQGTSNPFVYLKHKNSPNEFCVTVRRLDPRESDPSLA